MTPRFGRARTIGALLMAVPDGDALTYVGRVGSGFTEKDLADTRLVLSEIEVPEPPVEGIPAIDRKGASGRHGIIKGGGVHLRAERGKLGFQHARRAFRFRALQAVRADQLGAQAGFMHGRSLFGAHFHKADRESSVR